MNKAEHIRQLAEQITGDVRWAAVVNRSAEAEGRFVYAVATTGVFCRPSCRSRLPKPENVRFFDDADTAQAAGFRPCLRCTPDQESPRQRQARLIAAACQQMQQAEVCPALDELAAQAGMSRFHFHRLFTAITGVTPKAYAMAIRQQRLRQQLTDGASVTEAIYQAGYASSSRCYAESNQVLGMSPRDFKSGGQQALIYFALGECSLGAVLVAQSLQGICAILLGDEAADLLLQLQQQFPHAELIGADTAFEQQVAQVIGLIEAPQQVLDLPLDIRGTAFQQKVWQALRHIPPGQIISYSELAQRIGSPKAIRAVASACAANTLAVAIPCHRVVRHDGNLAGYRWGIERKQTLLQREQAAIRPQQETDHDG